MATNSRQEIDRELVAAAQGGDLHAFEALMRRYRSRLLRYLAPMLRDLGETEDVVQETFIKAYTSLKSFRSESSFSTWLFRIGINSAKRSLRRSRVRIPQADERAYENTASQQRFERDGDNDTPEARLQSKQILNMLDTALDALPEEQRTALVLRELEGMSYDEIAHQMDTPVGTVRSRIHRARDTIAAVLKREDS